MKLTPLIVLLFVIFAWQYSSLTIGTVQIAVANQSLDITDAPDRWFDKQEHDSLRYYKLYILFEIFIGRAEGVIVRMN